MKKFRTTLLFCFCCTLGLAQQKVRYHQTNSPYADNIYILKKLNNHPFKGTFERIMDFDDGQKWHGRGTYIETGNKIIFNRYILIGKAYSAKGNNIKGDTSIIIRSTFYKKGNTLIEYDLDAKTRKRIKIVYVKY